MKQRPMRRLVIIIIALVACTLRAFPQGKITGVVVDSLTGKSLQGATVMLLRGGKTMKFSRTDAQGRFAINIDRQDGDELQATLLGYAKKRQKASDDNTLRLSEQGFELREVKVEGSSVRQRRDTITYDITKFTSDRDNSLKDVLRKLPGVEVGKNGEISYNGQPLSRFTVEGLDLSKGQYNKLTENIHARDVKKAEVMEHDQPIKALRNRVFTDNVAMNIVLKDSARDQLMLTLRPYVLVGEPTNVGGDAVGMQIGKNRQMEYVAQYDRTGRDLSNQFSIFYDAFDFAGRASVPVWYSVPSLRSPIDDERMRFNTSQAYSVDYLSKGRNESENSFSASYNRNVIRQHTQNISQYFITDGSPEETTEDERMTLHEDAFSMDYNHRINAERHYGNFVVKADANQDDGMSHYEGGASQRVRTPEVNASASISQTYTLRRGVLRWRSTADFHHSKDKMYLSGLSSADESAAVLSLENNLWHTSHSLSLNRQYGHWHRDYGLSIEAENLNVASENNTLLSLSTSPSWYYDDDDWRISLSPGINLRRFTHQGATMLLPKGSIYVSRNYGNRTDWTWNAAYAESTSAWETLAIESRRTNYRTWTDAPDFVPRMRRLSSSFTYNYKRAFLQFFSNLRLSYAHQWNSAALDMQITDGNYHYQWTKHNTDGDNLNLSVSVSKGWRALKLKTDLDIIGSYATGEQYSSGAAIDYKYFSYGFQPQIIYSPSWLEIDYKAEFTFNRSRSGQEWMRTLADWTQRIGLTSTIRNVDLTLAAVLYHNEIDGSPSVNTLLADAKMVWRLKRVRITAALRNIFDKDTYSLTTYSGVGVFTNRYWLRPRELMISAQFNL